MYRKLSKEDAFALASRTLAYLFTTKALDEMDEPADELPVVALPANDRSSMLLTFINGQNESSVLSLAPHNYGTSWYLALPASFEVPTPHGVLRVKDKCDTDYPGVVVETPNPCKGDNLPDITLTMVEYVPGGEVVYDDDIPRTRMDLHPADSGGILKPGFVTRAWADELHDENRHNRTFHYGYQDALYEEQRAFEDAKTEEKRAWNAYHVAWTSYGTAAPETIAARERWERASSAFLEADETYQRVKASHTEENANGSSVRRRKRRGK